MREEEIRRYELLLAGDPNSRAFAPLAEAYRKAGDLDKALAIAQTGLRIHPDYIGGLVVAGRVLLEKGDYKKARDSLARA
ncbi:MAG: tetratricopeptide repeat protein, partial [bacterium]